MFCEGVGAALTPAEAARPVARAVINVGFIVTIDRILPDGVDEGWLEEPFLRDAALKKQRGLHTFIYVS